MAHLIPSTDSDGRAVMWNRSELFPIFRRQPFRNVKSTISETVHYPMHVEVLEDCPTNSEHAVIAHVTLDLPHISGRTIAHQCTWSVKASSWENKPYFRADMAAFVSVIRRTVRDAEEAVVKELDRIAPDLPGLTVISQAHGKDRPVYFMPTARQRLQDAYDPSGKALPMTVYTCGRPPWVRSENWRFMASVQSCHPRDAAAHLSGIGVRPVALYDPKGWFSNAKRSAEVTAPAPVRATPEERLKASLVTLWGE